MTINGQILLNSIIAASFGYLMAMAIAPTYRLFRYFDLSLAGISLIAGYGMVVCYQNFGLPPIVSGLIGVVLSVLIHLLIKIAFLGCLVPKVAASTMLIISLCIYICLIGMLSLIFGSDLVAAPHQFSGRIICLSIGRITYPQGLAIVFVIAFPLTLAVLMKWTRIGLLTRAVSADIILAQIMGIKITLIALFAATISGIGAGITGTLFALDVGLRPTIGLQPVLLGVVAVVIGMQKGFIGIGLAVLAIALLQNLLSANFGSQWQDAIVFFILMVFLLWKSDLVSSTTRRHTHK